MEKLTSEYPTEEQIKETFEAYLKGGDALLELIRSRGRAQDAARQASEPTDTQPPGS